MCTIMKLRIEQAHKTKRLVLCVYACKTSGFYLFFVINFIIILACCLIMYFTTPVKFAWTILAFFVTLLANFGFLCHTLQVEMQKPMIDWHDKAEITSHKNVSKCTLRGLLIGIVLGAFAFKFYLIAPQRAWFELLILAFLFAVYNVYTLLRRQNYLLKQINK